MAESAERWARERGKPLADTRKGTGSARAADARAFDDVVASEWWQQESADWSRRGSDETVNDEPVGELVESEASLGDEELDGDAVWWAAPIPWWEPDDSEYERRLDYQRDVLKNQIVADLQNGEWYQGRWEPGQTSSDRLMAAQHLGLDVAALQAEVEQGARGSVKAERWCSECGTRRTKNRTAALCEACQRRRQRRLRKRLL